MVLSIYCFSIMLSHSFHLWGICGTLHECFSLLIKWSSMMIHYDCEMFSHLVLVHKNSIWIVIYKRTLLASWKCPAGHFQLKDVFGCYTWMDCLEKYNSSFQWSFLLWIYSVVYTTPNPPNRNDPPPPNPGQTTLHKATAKIFLFSRGV